MIRISLKKHIFESVTDIMQCNIFSHMAQISLQETRSSAVCPKGGGSLNVMMASYWL